MTETADPVPDVWERVRSERLRAVIGQMPTVLGATGIIAALTAAVLAVSAGNRLAWLWLGAILTLTVARAIAWWQLRWSTDRHRLSRWVIGGAASAGALWGVLCLLTFPTANTYELLVAFVIAGMCAGAVAAYGAHFPSAVSFILLASLPLALRFLLDGQPLRLVLAAMVLVFTLGMVRVAWISHRNFGAVFRLQAEAAIRAAALDAAEAQLQVERAEHHATEAALRHVQRIRAIGQLTSGIAHDFNNMLTAIKGNLQLIATAAGVESKIRRYVNAAERAADRSTELVASLLDFARPEGPGAPAVQVNHLLLDFLPLLRRAAAPCRVETRLAEGLPDCALGAAQFQSALLNLVINARNASPQGGTVTLTTALAAEPVAAELAARQAAVPTRFVAVSVTDTGSGMTEDVASRAFEPFFTTQPQGKGSGLGLAQVLSFAREAGGRAVLQSTPGQGTAVTLFLPETRAAPADPPTV